MKKKAPDGDPSVPVLLKPRCLAAVILCAFFLLAGTTAYLFKNHYDSARRQTLKEDRAAAELLALILAEHIQIIVKTMESYAGRPLLVQAVTAKSRERAMGHLANLKKIYPGIESLVISDREGVLWATHPERPEVLGKKFAHREWYQGVSRKWNPYVTGVIRRVVGEKDLGVQIAVPICDRDGQPLAILLNTLRTEELAKLIRRLSLDPGAAISVTDREGQLIYSSRYDYVRDINTYPFFGVAAAPRAPPDRTLIANDKNGGGRLYISYAPIPGLDWTVFLDRDGAAFLRAQQNHLLQMGAISTLIFFIVVLFLVYLRIDFLNRQTRQQLQMERELQASEVRFRELFDNMPSGAAVYRALNDGEDFILLDLNKAGMSITDTYKDFSGRPVTEVFPGVRRMGVFEVLQRVWKTGIPEFFPTAVYTDERLNFWAENSVYKLPAGELVAIFTDVTDRVQMENRLRETTMMLEETIASSPLAIIVVDQESIVRIWNPAAERMFGWKAGEIIGRPLPIVPPEREEEFAAIQAAINQRQTVFIDRTHRRRKDGTHIEVSLSVAPVKNSQGVISGRLGIFTDITERLHAEEQLAAQLDELRRWHEATLGREMRILTLKEEVNALLTENGRPPRYLNSDPLAEREEK